MSDSATLRRRASQAAIAMTVTLIVAKLGAFIATESVSLLSSLVDSATDTLASLITMAGILQAQKGPDHAHRYGHGKAEALAALCQSAFVGGSALFLAIESVGRLMNPIAISDTGIGLGVMGLSIFLTGLLVAFQRYVIRKTGSVAIGADNLNYVGDLMTNSAVIVALGLTAWTGWLFFDPLFALGITAIMLRGATKIAIEALGILMDRELPTDQRTRLIALATSHPMVQGVHDVRTRSAGDTVFADLHLELDPSLPLSQAHDIAHAVEDNIRTEFPNAEILIHQEPAGIHDQRLDNIINKAE